MVRACTKIRLSEMAALRRPTLFDKTWVHDGNQVAVLVSNAREWSGGGQVCVTGMLIQTVGWFLHHSLQLAAGGNSDSMASVAWVLRWDAVR